ncbi:MAG TPA: family 20 glycosylhydrolase [Bryobacteraceae bacterium]|nr:family 20 glycosylhydrolase [Bryobacteraceae bacterium]
MRVATVITLFLLALIQAAGSEPLPIRGLHLMAPKPADVPLLVRFIREVLPKEGANTLVIEVNYRFAYTKHPEVIDPDPLSREDVASVVAAARQAGVRLIPQINLLGHQSWAKTTHGLLRSHPEFDETPGKYPGNEGIYCRSYCPLHPQVHGVIFDLIDELMEAFAADTFHGGMDEVFILADESCPRCRGRLPADLFAGEVRAVRDHLARSGRKLWIWGDRLLDGAASGAGKWEASFNGTWTAIDRIPRDVLICDWHYEKAVPGAAFFAMHGFDVVSSPWRKPEVALAQIDMLRTMRERANAAVASRAQGLLQTTWGDSGDFMRACFGQPSRNEKLNEALRCFRAAFQRLRE